jgi:hypothetical protein
MSQFFLQSGRQNGENRVSGGTAYPKCTQGYASVERGLSKWSAKIKIGQANRLKVTNKWFLFLGSSYVSVLHDLAAKTVKIGLGVPSTTPRVHANSLVLTVFDHFE